MNFATFALGVESLQMRVPRDLLLQAFQQLDANKDGRLSFDEFAQLWGQPFSSAFGLVSGELVSHIVKVMLAPKCRQSAAAVESEGSGIAQSEIQAW